MTTNPSKSLISRLNQIKGEIDNLVRPESQEAFKKNLDDLITILIRVRAGLTNPSLQERAVQVSAPLKEVIDFLEFAKSDDLLKLLLAPTRTARTPKAKRKIVEIRSDLTNEQIRALLEQDLSKAELKAIAAQRAISVGKSTNDEIKRSILKNLQRQESYGRLAS
jgi:hypothetical protein